jgi:transcriptional regulator with XRE-family HTH domain
MAIKKLKQAIVARGWTTSELAEKSGVKKRTLDNWLYGKTPNPLASDLSKASAALGVSVEYLLTGKNSEGLTEEEGLLLSVFRGMTRQQRAMFLRIASAVKDGGKG